MTTNNSSLRIGIIGVGAFGTRIGLQFRALPEVTVVALADVSDEALRMAGDRLGVRTDARYSEYGQLLHDESLNAVVVATPHTLHYEQITAALDRDLHVLSEKPLVVDGDQARELRSRAASSEQVLMVGYQRHLDTAFRRVRDRYTDGPAITHVTAEIASDWIRSFAGTWRTDHDLSAGGLMTDTGRHVIDAVLWTTGLEPTTVRAEMEFAEPGIERFGELSLTFDGEARASIVAVGTASSVRETYHFWDAEGGVRVFGRGWGPREFVRVDTDGGEYSPEIDRSTEQTKAEAFVAAVLHDEPLPATPRDAVQAQSVIEAAYESVRSNKRININI